MRSGIFILALGVLWSSQVSAGELQSVYVAPGGVYIASAITGLVTVSGADLYSSASSDDIEASAPCMSPE